MRRPATRTDDDGQVLLLVLGYALLLLLLVVVVTAATSVHLARTRLAALADGAAVAAASTVDRPTYYDPATGGAPGGGDLQGVVPLSATGVQADATAYLGQAIVPSSLRSVAVGRPTGTPDGRTAEVTLVAVVRPALLGPVLQAWSGGVPMRVTGRARTTQALP